MAIHWTVVEVIPKEAFSLWVRFKEAFSLWVRFADGLSGIVELKPEEFTGVLQPLRNAGFFAQAYVDHGAVTWPGEIDLAPDVMYRQIQ